MAGKIGPDGKRPKTGGRQKGTKNKRTVMLVEACEQVFRKLGGVEAFSRWARQNPGHFYALFAKLQMQPAIAAVLQQTVVTDDLSDFEAARRMAFILTKGAAAAARTGKESPLAALPMKDVTPDTTNAQPDSGRVIDVEAATMYEARGEDLDRTRAAKKEAYSSGELFREEQGLRQFRPRVIVGRRPL